MRFFNTAGPVNCSDHYCLPPLERFDLAVIEMLLAQKKYFVLHAPHQTGKTTSMLALVDHLNPGGHYRALYAMWRQPGKMWSRGCRTSWWRWESVRQMI
jgi:hypothetical protein